MFRAIQGVKGDSGLDGVKGDQTVNTRNKR